MWILLVFVLPLLELFLLSHVGARLGGVATFALIVGTAVFGAWLARREGFGVLRGIQEDLAHGRTPEGRLLEGVAVVVGGLLLFIPGVLTDIVGFLLIAPGPRQWLVPILLLGLAGVSPGPGRDASPPSKTNPFSNKFDDL